MAKTPAHPLFQWLRPRQAALPLSSAWPSAPDRTARRAVLYYPIIIIITIIIRLLFPSTPDRTSRARGLPGPAGSGLLDTVGPRDWIKDFTYFIFIKFVVFFQIIHYSQLFKNCCTEEEIKEYVETRKLKRQVKIYNLSKKKKN